MCIFFSCPWNSQLQISVVSVEVCVCGLIRGFDKFHRQPCMSLFLDGIHEYGEVRARNKSWAFFSTVSYDPLGPRRRANLPASAHFWYISRKNKIHWICARGDCSSAHFWSLSQKQNPLNQASSIKPKDQCLGNFGGKEVHAWCQLCTLNNINTGSGLNF